MKAETSHIKITPLGAGQQVGRSCIVVKIKDKTIIFDTGIHMQYSDMQKYPDFKHICGENDINNYVDVVIVTHFHLDHCGGLPYLTEHFKYKGPIYATMPTKAMIPYMLQDFRKVTEGLKNLPQGMYQYSAAEARWAAQKISSIALEETIVYKGIKITPYYAGHVLGAGMFLVEYDGLSVMYTGDYNSYADRHLGAANAPRLNPNVIITETTYATTIRDTKRDRERKMLKIVTETVENGGKVLIPVFALGRAQELSVLLQTYWNRTDNTVPVYFSAGLIQKANFYYKLFVQWQNQKIKQDFLTNNLFNFKKVKPFDKSLIKADIPYVLFATPGMLHGGTSLQVFKEWCSNPKNTIIIPGYCVPGTFGNKLLNGVKKMQIDYREYEVNMKVQNISFSAHADAKGIINLIRHVNAENIVFVHGDKQKMEIFESVVREHLNKPVFRPANKETIKIPCTIRKQILVKDSGTIPKEPAMEGYLLNKNGGKGENNFKFLDDSNLMRELNLMKEMLGCCGSEIVQQQIVASLFIENEQKIREVEKIRFPFMNVQKIEINQNEMQEENQISIKKQEQILEDFQKKIAFKSEMKQENTQSRKICLKGQIKDIITVMQQLP